MHATSAAADTAPQLSPADEHRIAHEVAAETGRDHRAVLREMRGEHVRGRAGDDIRHALARRGIRA